MLEVERKILLFIIVGVIRLSEINFMPEFDKDKNIMKILEMYYKKGTIK